MLITAVLDPSAYNRSHFDESGYRVNAEMFLRGVWTNGLLIVDRDGLLSEQLLSEIKTLPTSVGQTITIWLEELLKNKRRRIIKCHCSSHVSDHRLICQVARTAKVDAAVSGTSTYSVLRQTCGLVITIVELSNYLSSSLESQRFNYELGLQRIDRLPEAEVNEAFKRAMLFSTRLRFYDKQIGKGVNTSHFRKGIFHILDLWKNSGYFQGLTKDINVEVITTLKNSEIPQHDDNKEAYDKITRELVEPLRNRYSAWNIELKVKVDAEGIFHRRYLEAQPVILEIDRGFDLFRPGGKLKRNTLRLENAAYDHLRECRALPDASFA